MYLTEITLQDEAAARLFPSNPYNWHRTVWQFFPNRQQRDFLYLVGILWWVLAIIIFL